MSRPSSEFTEQRWSEALAPYRGPDNPILSAVEFAHQSNAGGSSMLAKSGQFFSEGDNAHMVGAHPGTDGKPVPGAEINVGADDPKMTPMDAIQQRVRIRQATGDSPDVALGSWQRKNDEDGKPNAMVVDASTAFRDRGQAEDATLARDEDAMWSMDSMSETKNSEIRAQRGLPPRPKRD
jgi:hypothetical protein